MVGPEDPLAAGVVDVFEQAGIRAFGPSAQAARLEADIENVRAAIEYTAETGDEVACGPYRAAPDAMEAYVEELRGCINDFRAQGYVRIGKPSS